MDLEPVQLLDEGLGNTAWLVDLGDGRALAVDPPRDLRPLRAEAERRRLTVAFAADTHLHADFISGVRQLAATDGATMLASAAGQREFDHVRLADGDEVDLGGLTLQALATPGHTDEHLSFTLLDGARPVGVFTGGSLIVGGAARTDLLGDDRAAELARAQYGSLRRLASLPDATRVWPTHGAGSFCSSPAGGGRSSTIGAEKAGNPLFSAPDADTFTERLQAGLGTYPSYFGRLAEVNRKGPAVIDGDPVLPPLDPSEVRRLLRDGAVAVDVRPTPDIAAGHIPGALAIPLRAQFATWLGWLVDPATPVVVVRNPDQDPADIVWAALNIGYERLVGELRGGVRAWTADGGELTTVRLVRPDEVAGPVLDVRQEAEFASGHLPGATHVELGTLPQAVADLDPAPRVVMCGIGERAMTAASILERAGHGSADVLVGGAEDWARATGERLR